MFFRTKTSGPRTYLQIVENRWEEGRPRQRVGYEELYPMFVAVRDQISGAAGVKETSPPKAKKANRFLPGKALGPLGRQDDQTRRDPAARVSE
jgi:hypothetical protein